MTFDTARSVRAAGASEVSGVHRYTLASLWLLTIAAAAIQLILAVETPMEPRLVTVIVLTVVSVVVSFALIPQLLRGPGAGTPWSPLVLAALVTGGVTWVGANLPPFAGWSWAVTTAMAAGVLACLVGAGRRHLVVAVMVAVLVAVRLLGVILPGDALSWEYVVGGDPFFFGLALLSLGLPYAYISILWVLDVVVRLDRAARLASDLAIARERLRFATDLHDIQGHSLQVLALKSELAERLLTSDPAGTGRELAQMRRIAKDALDDTRAIVNNYRTVTVAVETRNAAGILRSAGIACELRIEATDIPAGIGTVFGVAIREATTNMLRHSRAATATVELVAGLNEYRLTVVNDGASATLGGGTGLMGLRDRVEEAGGFMTARRDGADFTLAIVIPIPARENATGKVSG